MKLRNKKTGEVVKFHYLQSDYISPLVLTIMRNGKPVMIKYNSLAKLNEEWEDYEEPKEYWAIDCFSPDGCISEFTGSSKDVLTNRKEIGNYFDTREEAEKAVEKLKAWKRLKDEGLKINRWLHRPEMKLTTGSFIKIEGYIPAVMKNIDDLDLLFSQEED